HLALAPRRLEVTRREDDQQQRAGTDPVLQLAGQVGSSREPAVHPDVAILPERPEQAILELLLQRGDPADLPFGIGLVVAARIADEEVGAVVAHESHGVYLVEHLTNGPSRPGTNSSIRP